MILQHQYGRNKHQRIRFNPFYQLTYRRELWELGTCNKVRRFETEAETRAFLSALRRRKSKSGGIQASLEHRDRYGIWHTLPVDQGGAA